MARSAPTIAQPLKLGHITAAPEQFSKLSAGRHYDSLAALLFRWGVVLPLLQDLAATSLNPIHLIRKGKPSLREQRKTFLHGWFDR
jgi:hypothetical protein